MKYTRCELSLLVKAFFLFLLLFFRHLKITLDSEQPMLEWKQIIPSVWGGIKRFAHFQTGLYFSDNGAFDLWVNFVSSASPAFAGLYPVISSYGHFFLHAQIYLPLQNQLYPCLQSKNRNANACEWTNLCAFKLLSFKNFLGTIEGQQAYSRRKDYFDHFSVAQVIIVRVFFL